MAAASSHRRVVLARAVAGGIAIGVAFAVVDILVDVTVLGEGSLAVNAREPLKLWARGFVMALSVAGSVAYARALLAREDVASAAQRYRVLAESARDDIFVVDPDLRISYVNAQGAKEFGERPDALVGKRVSELFGGESLEMIEADLRKAFGGTESYSETKVHFPGRDAWLSTRVVPLPGPHGPTTSVLGIARDITAAKREIGLSDALSCITEAVHSRLSIESVLQTVVVEVAAAAGVDGSIVLTRDEGGWTIRFAEGYPDDMVGTRLSYAEARSCEIASASRRLLAIDDTANDDRVNPETVKRFGVRSILVVPLLKRRGVTGVLVLCHRTKPVHFTSDTIEFAERVGTTVSLAIENARLYEEKSDVADTLQTAFLMLPARLSGVEFAHAYRSATEAARVGGDFYDLFELEHRLVGIVVGDISGHGLHAAVLTSLVKNAIRVQATQQSGRPNDVMATASQLLYDTSPEELFATVFFGVLHLDDGLLEYCSAGHTTGVCICSGGAVQELPSNSPLIGAFPGQEFELSTERLDVGDLLFLYTDGLTEARRGSELFGEERLFELLARQRGGDPEETVHAVFDEVLAFAGGVLADDLAILAVERAAGNEQRL